MMKTFRNSYQSNDSFMYWVTTLLLICITSISASATITVLDIENGSCGNSQGKLNIESFEVNNSVDANQITFTGDVSYSNLQSSLVVVTLLLRNPTTLSSYTILNSYEIDICDTNSSTNQDEDKNCPEYGSRNFSGTFAVQSDALSEELKDYSSFELLASVSTKNEERDEENYEIIGCCEVNLSVTKEKQGIFQHYFTHYIMCSVLSGAGLTTCLTLLVRSKNSKRVILSLNDANFIEEKECPKFSKSIDNVIRTEWCKYLEEGENCA